MVGVVGCNEPGGKRRSIKTGAFLHQGVVGEERKGTLIGPMDLLIAGHARSEGLVLVTNNTREFCRVEKLMMEDWTREQKESLQIKEA